jgi:hypothetical protein
MYGNGTTTQCVLFRLEPLTDWKISANSFVVLAIKTDALGMGI